MIIFFKNRKKKNVATYILKMVEHEMVKIGQVVKTKLSGQTIFKMAKCWLATLAADSNAKVTHETALLIIILLDHISDIIFRSLYILY